eukprot:Rmarinus@m.16464
MLSGYSNMTSLSNKKKNMKGHRAFLPSDPPAYFSCDDRSRDIREDAGVGHGEEESVWDSVSDEVKRLLEVIGGRGELSTHTGNVSGDEELEEPKKNKNKLERESFRPNGGKEEGRGRGDVEGKESK